MIAVTGATGKLGRLIVEQLVQKVPAASVVAIARNAEKAESLKKLGVEVRIADYTQPEALERALAGVEKLVLVSGSEVGQRLPQHTNVIEAAKKAGVKLVAYTSILHADTSPLALAAEHKATEEKLRASGLGYVLLRNGWYFENYTANLGPALEHGAIFGTAGDGRIAAASRADFAAAAVAVVTSEGHAGKVYELAGDEAFTMAELAAAVSARSGKTVVYEDLPAEEYEKTLLGVGVPAPFAKVLVDSDVNIRKGALDDQSHDLSRLIGRPTTKLADAVAAALPT